jgi:hypothetical protein
MSGSKRFYALGQSVRARGWSKDQGIAFFGLESLHPYTRIYFDKGYRGLAFK